MSRRNLQRIFVISLISLICYQKADSAQRDRYGRMAETFIEALGQIEENYLEEVDRRELFEAALSGMTDHLDEHSSYVGMGSYGEFQENLEQEFGGIGIQVTVDPESRNLKVLSPLVGTPAYEAGILAGDTIVGIDGRATEDFPTTESAIQYLRGRPGETVRLAIVREGAEEPIEIEVERAVIQIDTVLGDTRRPDGAWNFFLAGGDKIGYLRINSFSEKTVDELKSTLALLREAGMQGLILDLRNNPGGLLKAAVGTCDLFIDEGRIVSTRGRAKTEQEVYDAQSSGTYLDVPIVILVNRYSASASEIVAACLQDHGRAVIVGERTFGKGTVQNLIRLEGGLSALKLTVGTYWRPNGKDIHRRKDVGEDEEWGARPLPENEVKLDTEAFRDWMEWRRDRDVVTGANGDNETVAGADRADARDAQLARAIEVLEELIEQPRSEIAKRAATAPEPALGAPSASEATSR